MDGMLSLQVTKWLYKVIWTIDTLYVHVGQTLTSPNDISCIIPNLYG